MAFPVEFIERLKAANPIEDVMGQYVTLKRSGQDLKCLCPFHNEKTPSCVVHPDRDFFHCFGCGAGGDVIAFMKLYHNLDTYTAISQLAERGNIDMPIDSFSGKRTGVTEKKRFYEMNKDAAKFFYSQLSTKEGQVCVRYLMQTRGLSKATITRYGMGFAPNSWNALKNHMMGLGYTEKELLDGGLISSSRNNSKKTFDFFVNRAMFPFIDLSGHILGFGGRTLGDDKRKYINSKDSPVYNKNKFLFSLNIAKNESVKSGRLLLCEGNLDVISLTQAGFENAVASCGTALTAEQAKLMSNYAKEVVICYDSDEAGQKATQKAIAILSQAGLKTLVIHMKGAKDPDEYVRKFGSAAFSQLINGALGAVSYKLDKARSGIDMQSEEGKLEYKDRAVAILAEMFSPVERDIYGHKVASELGVAYTVLESEVEREMRRRRKAEEKRQQQEMIRFADRRDPLNPQAASHPGEANAEELIIGYLYSNPDYFPRVSAVLAPDRFVTDFNRRVYAFIADAMKNMYDFSLSSMNEVFNEEEISKITKILERTRSEAVTVEVADECVQKLLSYKPKVDVGNLSDAEFEELFRQRQKKK